MTTSKAPSLDAQIAALGIAFIELSKKLGVDGRTDVVQLSRALESAATVLKANAETMAAVSELARRLRS